MCDGYKVIGQQQQSKAGSESKQPASERAANNQSKKGLVSAEVGRRYDEYVSNISERASKRLNPFDGPGTTEVVRLKKHVGFAYAVKEALTRLSTPYVMVVQHDFAFLRPFDLDAGEARLPTVIHFGRFHSRTLLGRFLTGVWPGLRSAQRDARGAGGGEVRWPSDLIHRRELRSGRGPAVGAVSARRLNGRVGVGSKDGDHSVWSAAGAAAVLL